MKATLRICGVCVAMAFATPGGAEPFVTFRTPSNNIHCIGSAGGAGSANLVTCDIYARNSQTPIVRKPADCEGDWGYRFTVAARGPAGLECGTDALLDDRNPVLNYDRAITIGAITCQSSQAGLQCRNPEGRGFFLSRARQQLY